MMVYTNQYQYVTMVGEIIHKIKTKQVHNNEKSKHKKLY